MHSMFLLALLLAACCSAHSLIILRTHQASAEAKSSAPWLDTSCIMKSRSRSLLFHAHKEDQGPNNSESLLHENGNSDNRVPLHLKSLDQALESRYACKAFQRSDGSERSLNTASVSDPHVVEMSRKCINLARLAPSAFNTQPYRIVLVHSAEQKQALSQYCLGPNQQRVLDADCTAVFLADRQILKSTQQFTKFSQHLDRKKRPLPKIVLMYVAIFSSGFPLPRVVSSIVSFCMRMGVGIADWFSRKIFRKCFLPSLSSAETWASKQATMVAMAYMLACAACGVDTIPMEGINASGIRSVLNIRPQGRYAIPLIVATGIAAEEQGKEKLGTVSSRRYETNSIVFENSFGNTLEAS